MSKKYSEKKVVNNPYFRSHFKKFLFLVEPCINPSLSFLLLICSSFSYLLKKKRIFLSPFLCMFLVDLL
jgi:hypothetical protein